MLGRVAPAVAASLAFYSFDDPYLLSYGHVLPLIPSRGFENLLEKHTNNKRF